jgi:hypothetical protein
MNWLIEKAKHYKKELVIFILFFLISSTSFALGYLAAGEFNTPPIVIEQVERP